MESQQSKLQPNDSIESLLALITSASRNFQDAGTMLCRLLAVDADVVAKICAKAPSMSPGFLANLIRVGEKTLHPNLLLNNCPAYQKLRAIPYTAQARALASDHIDLVTDSESGSVLRVAITEMSPQQASQVFTRDGIRSRDDQRAWLKLKQVSKARPAGAEPALWFVRKDKLLISRACELSRTQLLAILAEMS